MLENDYNEYSEILSKYAKNSPSKEADVSNLENMLVENMKIFSYSDLKQIANTSDFVKDFYLSKSVKAKIVIKPGMIQILVKNTVNKEVFNGVWSNLTYDKIVERAKDVFSEYKS